MLMHLVMEHVDMVMQEIRQIVVIVVVLIRIVHPHAPNMYVPGRRETPVQTGVTMAHVRLVPVRVGTV
jgi:hypothetical protein